MPSSFARLTGNKPAVEPRIIALPKLTGYENLRSPEEKGAFLRKFDEQIDAWRKSIIFPTDIDATVTTTVEEAMAAHQGEEPLIFIPPLVRSGNAISIQAASATTDGYLTSEDWNTFNNALTFPVVDSTVLLKGSDSPDKLLRIEIDGFTAGVTRIITPPDADIDLPGTNIANTWDLLQTFTSGISVGAADQILLNPDGTSSFAGTLTIGAAVSIFYDTGAVAVATGNALFAVDGRLTIPNLTLSVGEISAPNFSLSAAGLLTLADGVRQIFNPDGTNSGLNVGAHTADPSALVNGDIFYQSTTNELRAQINGATVTLSTSVSGAPSNATYITQTPDGTLTNEQALSLLATGLLKNTTATGILSIAAQGVDYYAPGGTDVAVADGGTGASTAAGARTNLGLVIGTDVQAFNAILQDIAGLTQATDKIIYFDSATTAATADLTAFARTLIDDADATAARVTLGVVIGTNVQAFDATLSAFAAYNTNGLLTQTAADTFTGRTITGTADKITVTNGDGVAGNPTLTIASTYVGQTSITTLGTIVTGAWTGTTIAIANGGTGATTAAGARTNLGLVIGTNVQAWSAILDDIAGLTQATDKLIYFDSATTAATADLSAFARTLIDDANAAAARTTLGLVIGTDVQAFDATLSALAAFNTNGFLVQTAANTFAGRTITGTINQVIVFDGDGVGGSPALSLPQNIHEGATPTFAGLILTGTITFPDDIRQTFNPGAANPGLNVGAIAGDPSAPSNGDLWYDSTANELTARINGANVALGAGGGGAPTTATYIVQTPDATLSNEQALSALATGILKSTTTTGVLSIAAAGTDYESPLTFSAPLSRAVNTISIPQANGSTDGFLDSADWTIFNSKQDALPVSDATAIVKGSVTASKLLRFEVDGFTAATTRVITPPDADITLAGTNIANTWAVVQTFSDGFAASGNNTIPVGDLTIGAGAVLYDPGTGELGVGGNLYIQNTLTVESDAKVLTYNGEEGNAEISVFNVDTSTNTFQVFGDGTVHFGSSTAQIAADGIFTGPRMEVELSMEVQTRAGEEADIEFSVYNVDTATEKFHILGDGSFVSDGTATIGSLTGVIIGTAGLLSAVADLPFSSLAQGSALSVLGVTGNATADNASIAAGSDHQVLRRSGTAVAFGSIDLAQSAAVTGILGVANGGSGTSTAFTAGSVIFAGAAGVYSQDNAGLFWNDASNRLGIGAVTTSSHGTCTVARTQSNSALAAADAHILVRNPSGSQSMLIFATGAGDTIRGGVRSDSSGNFNWHASGSQGHQFYGSNAVSDTNVVAGFSLSGVVVGGIAGSVSVARFDVTTRATTNIGVIVKALANHTANLLEIWSSANAVMASFGPRGDLSIIPGVASSGNPVSILLTGAAHTNLTTTAETIDVNFNLARTVQHATGGITTQRAMLVQAPTYSFVGTSTIGTAATLAITAAPVAGTNATITNAYAFWVQAGISRFDGNLSLNDGVNIALGTTTGTMIGTGAVEKLGFWGVTPVVASVDWAPTNVTNDKVFDANATTLDELSDIVGTLINVLKVYGLLG